MNLTKNFTLEELTKTAQKADNTPTPEAKKHLQETAEMLQSLRDFYGKPISINSGYRSPAVNKLVGGSNTSAHSRGYAADTKPSDGDMRTYQKAVLKWAETHDFDQIIIEYPTKYVAKWIHIGLKNSANKCRKQIIYTTNGKSYPKCTKEYWLN